MNLLSLAAVVILLPFSLCSCGVYEIATTPAGDDRDLSAAVMIICPPLIVTGTKPLPGSQPLSRDLSCCARVIRNRNAGKPTDENARDTHIAMSNAFSLSIVQQMSAEQITALFGPPDRRETIDGRTVFYYRITSPRGTHEDVPLYLDRETKVVATM